MPSQSESTVWTAYLSPTTSPVATGSCVSLSPDGTFYELATAAARTASGRNAAGITLSTGDATNRAVRVQFVGVVPPSISGLGAGVAGPVRVSGAGVLERGAVGDVVGRCDADGTSYLNFAGSGGSGSGGTGLKFSVLDFGAVGDGTTDDLPAFNATMAAARTAFGKGLTIIIPGDHTYRLAGNLDVWEQMRITSFDGPGSYRSTALLKFDVGFGIYLHSSGQPPMLGGADGTEIDHIRIDSTPISSSNHPPGTVFKGLWTAFTSYSIGDVVLADKDNRFIYQCTRAGTSGATQPMHDTRFDTIGGANVGKGLFSGAFDDPNGGGGTCQWTTDTISGIRSMVYCNLHDLSINGFTNSAINLFGNTPTFNSTCGGSIVRNVLIGLDAGCGCGIVINGGDANKCLVDTCLITGCGTADPWQHPLIATSLGGYGVVSTTFYGQLIQNVDIIACTGEAYFIQDTLRTSTLLGCYQEEVPSSNVNCLTLSHIGAFVPPYPAGFDASGSAFWHQLRIGYPDRLAAGAPQILLDNESFVEFNSKQNNGIFSYLDTAYRLSERYTDTGATHPGYWVTGFQDNEFSSTDTINRDILGWSTIRAGYGLGKGHLRHFWGEMRGGYGTTPYFIAWSDAARHDTQLRLNQGIGGNYRVGDRYEPGGSSSVLGKVVTADGWATENNANGQWSVAQNLSTYDQFIADGTSGAVRHPVTPDGYTYAVSKAGLTHATTEPTWSSITHYIDSVAGLVTRGTAVTAGAVAVVPYEWTSLQVRKVGDYGAPSTRNGHYYKVTGVSSPDADGYNTGASVEPTWATGGSSTTLDGNLLWTEQGSDANTHLTDNNVVWQCVGPEPTWADYSTGGSGTITGIASVGAGASLADGVSGSNVQVRSITTGSGLTATQNTNDVSVAITGGSNGTFLTWTGGGPSWGNIGTFFGSTGTNATIGLVRAANNTNIVVSRNSFASQDMVALATSNSNDLFVGEDTSLANGHSNTRICAISGVYFTVGGSIQANFSGGTFNNVVPMLGAGSPYGAHGDGTVTGSGGTTTLNSAEYLNHVIKLAGVGTTFVFPAPNTNMGYVKWVFYTGGSGSVTVSTGSGTTVSLGPTGWHIMSFTSNGVEQLL